MFVFKVRRRWRLVGGQGGKEVLRMGGWMEPAAGGLEPVKVIGGEAQGRGCGALGTELRAQAPRDHKTSLWFCLASRSAGSGG